MTIFDGVRFNGKHSYRDYGMFVVRGGLDKGSPAPKTRLVDIPGADGLLDFTESAGGTVRYANRSMNLLFKIRIDEDKRAEFQAELDNEIHGQQVTVIFDNDPEWYYEGRATVAYEDVEDWQMKVRILVNAQPYKLSHDLTAIEIGADSFTQSDIFFADDARVRNDASVFFDVGKVSNMTYLVLRWDASSQQVGPASVYVSDGSNYYSADNFSYGDYELDIPVTALSSLDMTAIQRVILYGIRDATLYKRTAAGALVTVYNDRMPVCPYWENPNEDPVTVHVNGIPFELNPGETINPDIVFKPLENQLALTSDSVPEAPLVVRFRKGRL